MGEYAERAETDIQRLEIHYSHSGKDMPIKYKRMLRTRARLLDKREKRRLSGSEVHKVRVLSNKLEAMYKAVRL